MSKIYNAQGTQMNVVEILGEVSETITDDQALILGKSIQSQPTTGRSDRILAHAILDCYKEFTDERMRRLLDNLMTKYQKSVGNIQTDVQSAYHSLICDILRKANLKD